MIPKWLRKHIFRWMYINKISTPLLMVIFGAGGVPSIRESLRYRTLVFVWHNNMGMTFMYSPGGKVDKVILADGSEDYARN